MLDNRVKFISLFFIFMLVLGSITIIPQGYADNNNSIVDDDYNIYRHFLYPTCIEHKESDTMDALLIEDPKLYLMCLKFFIDDAGDKIDELTNN